MYNQKQKDDMQRIIEGIARLERPQDKYPDIRSLEVRPILPMDLGLETWVWTSEKVKLQPRQHIAVYGIYSRFLLQVEIRTGSEWGNMVAAVSTGQPLYEPYLWRPQEARWVTWKPLENISSVQYEGGISFSILGYVIELAGMTIA